jgi:hypothetical protein
MATSIPSWFRYATIKSELFYRHVLAADSMVLFCPLLNLIARLDISTRPLWPALADITLFFLALSRYFGHFFPVLGECHCLKKGL